MPSKYNPNNPGSFSFREILMPKYTARPVTPTWRTGDYSNMIFRRYMETGNPESFPTWSQFQWIYPHSTKADYERARANAPVRQQSAPVANPTSVNYSRYIPTSGTNYIMAGAPAPSLGRAAAPATDWDALHSRLGEPAAVNYMTADGLSSDRNSSPRTATPPASTQRTGTAVAAKPGETVAAMWTRVTGLPWKTAKEMGLTDGSYARNIEILKGLKSGRINKDYINGLANGEGVTTEEASYAPGAYTPTIAVPEARPFGYVPVQAEPRAMEPELRRADLPAGIVYDGVDMTAPTEREANMAAKGGRIIRYVPVW